MENQSNFSPLANAVVSIFEKKEDRNTEPKISVNRFLSALASWYERFRNSMDIRDEEVILRAAIERILKRRFILGGKGETIAEPLLRELIWARYFPNNTIPESMIQKTADAINLYMALRQNALLRKSIKEQILTDWIFQLLSCHIARLLSPNIEKNTMSNFMFHILKNSLIIEGDTDDTKNVQIYLAVRRAFAKDDIAFLRFYLFDQIFGSLSRETLENTQKHFLNGYNEIEKQLTYSLKEKTYMFAKKQTPIFFILEDVMREHKENLREVLSSPEKLHDAVLAACAYRYKGIARKVRTAIVRSVIFLLITKALFALAVEGTYERIFYGQIAWSSIALNTGIPPFLMILVSFFIRTPGKDNSERIFEKIKLALFESEPHLTNVVHLSVHPQKRSLHHYIFGGLGMVAFILSFGFIIWVLTQLHFNIVSQFIFIFFITVVSFLSYRINSTAHMYSIDAKQGFFTPLIDFLIIPIVRVGMYLTEGISQINVIIFIFDFLIEAPFKGIFGFFEQWFSYLHAKREDLG